MLPVFLFVKIFQTKKGEVTRNLKNDEERGSKINVNTQNTNIDKTESTWMAEFLLWQKEKKPLKENDKAKNMNQNDKEIELKSLREPKASNIKNESSDLNESTNIDNNKNCNNKKDNQNDSKSEENKKEECNFPKSKMNEQDLEKEMKINLE